MRKVADKLRAIVKFGDSLDSSGVKQTGPPNRTLPWEEEAPAEAPIRRVRQGASATAGGPGAGRVLPGMPLEFDGDEEEEPRGRRAKFARADEPRRPWWRPASKTGRILLAAGALIVLGALAVAGETFKTFLERDGRFRIAGGDNIQATGLTEVSRGQLLPVFGEDIGRNIFFVPLSARRKELEKIPWVQQATVMRLLPDQIHVSIVERQPVAFTRHGNEVGLVDASGVLLSMPAAAMAKHHYSFPVLTGIDPGDSADARRSRMAVYQRMISELDAGGQHNSDQLSEIDLTDPEDARVTMPEQGTDILAHFGEDHFLERYQRYKAHIAEWKQQYPHLAAVDLRYDQQVVLQMASGKETAEGAGPGAGQDAAVPAKPTASDSALKPRTATKPAAKPSGSGSAVKKTSQPAKKIAEAKKTAQANSKKPVGKTAPAKAVPNKTAQGKTAQPEARSVRPGTPLSQGG